ncbi:hypothetical protein [Lacrimispora brassicae]
MRKFGNFSIACKLPTGFLILDPSKRFSDDEFFVLVQASQQ